MNEQPGQFGKWARRIGPVILIVVIGVVAVGVFGPLSRSTAAVPTEAVPTEFSLDVFEMGSVEVLNDIRADIGSDGLVRLRDPAGRILGEVKVADLHAFLDAHRAELARYAILSIGASPDTKHQQIILV